MGVYHEFIQFWSFWSSVIHLNTLNNNTFVRNDFKSSSLLRISSSVLSSSCLRYSSSILLNTKATQSHSVVPKCQLHDTPSFFRPLSCVWMKPRKRSTRHCWCSCSRSLSCSTPTRAKSRSTPTRSTTERLRTWSSGCPSAAPCWNRGFVSFGNHFYER